MVMLIGVSFGEQMERQMAIREQDTICESALRLATVARLVLIHYGTMVKYTDTRTVSDYSPFKGFHTVSKAVWVVMKVIVPEMSEALDFSPTGLFKRSRATTVHLHPPSNRLSFHHFSVLVLYGSQCFAGSLTDGQIRANILRSFVFWDIIILLKCLVSPTRFEGCSEQ